MNNFLSEEHKNVYSEFLRHQEELVIRLPEAGHHAEHAMRSFGDSLHKIAGSAARERHLYGTARAIRKVVLAEETNIAAYESYKSTLHFILRSVALHAFEAGHELGLRQQDEGITNG